MVLVTDLATNEVSSSTAPLDNIIEDPVQIGDIKCPWVPYGPKVVVFGIIATGWKPEFRAHKFHCCKAKIVEVCL